ncbi:MAG: hypothetical protein NTY15_12500, partial [Planctomycetota bacterium]|nr:hypothetical protein [Planctomycetota bacterium]
GQEPGQEGFLGGSLKSSSSLYQMQLDHREAYYWKNDVSCQSSERMGYAHSKANPFSLITSKSIKNIAANSEGTKSRT